MRSLHGKDVTLRITRRDGSVVDQKAKLRIDTPVEVDYFRHGGILAFVLRQLLALRPSGVTTTAQTPPG
jgi:aconitate hydratase